MCDISQERINELFAKAVVFGARNPGQKITPESLGANLEEYQALMSALDNMERDATMFEYG